MFCYARLAVVCFNVLNLATRVSFESGEEGANIVYLECNTYNKCTLSMLHTVPLKICIYPYNDQNSLTSNSNPNNIFVSV